MNVETLGFICELPVVNRACPEKKGAYFAPSDKCYRAYPRIPKNWRGAKNFCKQKGGRLASIHDRATNDHLGSLTDKLMWVGGLKWKNGQWKWNDGSAWDYENWGRGQPDNWGPKNQDRLAIGFELPGAFDDDYATEKRIFICQFEPMDIQL